jgi:hypothetical protein
LLLLLHQTSPVHRSCIDGLNVPQRTTLSNHTTNPASWLGHFGDLAIRAIGVPNSKLRYRSHFARYPAREYFSTLLLPQAGAREVAFGNEGYDVNNDLMLIKDSIDNDRNNRGEVGFPHHFNKNDHKAAGLEDGAFAN